MFQSQDENYTTIGDQLKLADGTLHTLMTAVIEKGASFRFRARGFSMFPFIRDRDIITLATLRSIGPGDVVAFRHPRSGKLAVHRILETKANGFLIKGDNIPEPDGIIPAKDILAVAVSVERGRRKVAGGMGHTKWLLALLSKRNMLWVFNPRLPLLPFAKVLQKAQELGTYRRVVRSFNPSFQISEAKEIDLEEAQDRFGFMVSTNPMSTHLVALKGSKVVGYVNLVRHSSKDAPYMGHWIHGLIVWLPYRGLGLGEALCREVIARARAEGAKEVRLLVYPQNRAAVNLYVKLGFKPTEISGLEERLEDELKAFGRRRITMSLKLCS